ncbi:hypothetical protein AB0B01_01820 [Streptomyces sp. NPDC044571]|uniref:hypothetical protein n=1 Tax=Streptomyces sp. NPDC044571 TaxID=3155371 RepID=UPI0033E46B59
MPFEDDLGEALRRAGDGFTADRRALVDAGEQHGRRLVARRRAAVVGGSVVALAVIGAGAAYTGGLFDGAGASGLPTVAAPPALPTAPPGGERAGSGAVSDEQLIGVLKQLLPGGSLSETQARGTGEPVPPMVSAVYDDGQGKAAVGIGLSRVDPKDEATGQAVACPDKNLVDFDGCTARTLADGSKLLVFQGYEYPDRRVPTKLWRATLVTPEGYQVDVQEWNAPAEKGKPVSRTDPPLDPEQLQALVTSPLWHPALADMPAAAPVGHQTSPPSGVADAGAVLQSLLPGDGITVVSKGGRQDYGYVVLDDGKGASLVEANVQSHMGELLAGQFAGPGITVLPDGTKVAAEQKSGEKGGRGVVWWRVDVLRPDGRRVVVSAFNTGNQNKPATRDEPVLTLEQLRKIALDPKWLG